MSYKKGWVRRLSAVLSAVMLMGTAIPASYVQGASKNNYKKGDVNKDGVINEVDAELVSRHILGLEKITDNTSLRNADCDGTRGVNMLDVVWILNNKTTESTTQSTTQTTTQTTTESTTQTTTQSTTESTTESTTATTTQTTTESTTQSTTETTTQTTTQTTTESAGELVEPIVNAFSASMPSTGDVKMLVVYVDFADKKYASEAYSAEDMYDELFGKGIATSYPYDSVSNWYSRASYGNLNLSGDVYTYTCSGNMSSYQDSSVGYEKMAMEVLSGLDSQIDYSDYDSDKDGVIDCISFTVPLDDADSDTLSYWYGCTATWWINPSYKIDNEKVGSYIITDVMPYKDNMAYLKQTMMHEMGHAMGLPDLYKYTSSSDWQGLTGVAGLTRMDDSIADLCGVSKLMLGWLREGEVQTYTGSGSQTFELSDASNTGSCLILPISSEEGDYASEYFLIEYVTDTANNSDIVNYFYDTTTSGVRIFHVQAEILTDYWGSSSFKYNNYSSAYLGDDKIRVVRLVNDGNGFYSSGDSATFGTTNFAGYDTSGNQTIDTGYTVNIGQLSDGKYTVTVTK